VSFGEVCVTLVIGSGMTENTSLIAIRKSVPLNGDPSGIPLVSERVGER